MVGRRRWHILEKTKQNPSLLVKAVLQLKMDMCYSKWNLAPTLVYTSRSNVGHLSNEGPSDMWVQPHSYVVIWEKPLGKKLHVGARGLGMIGEEPQTEHASAPNGDGLLLGQQNRRVHDWEAKWREQILNLANHLKKYFL